MQWLVNLPKHEVIHQRGRVVWRRDKSTHLEDNILAKPHISIDFQAVQIDDTWDRFEALQKVTNLCPQKRLAQVRKRYHHNGAEFCRNCNYVRTQETPNNFYLLEFRAQFNGRVRWVGSCNVTHNSTFLHCVQIRLRQKMFVKKILNLTYVSNSRIDPRYIWKNNLKNNNNRLPEKTKFVRSQDTWTSSKSEVALTGKNRERGTFTPMARSKNYSKQMENT